MFGVHLASFAELNAIVRENHETLEKMKRLIGEPAASSFPSGTELTETDRMREINKLVIMAKTLGEVAVSASRNVISCFLRTWEGVVRRCSV